MATYTEHYNLIKPALNDKVNINNLNDNADKIDTALYGKVNTSDTENIITSANNCMMSDGVTSVEDAVDDLGSLDRIVAIPFTTPSDLSSTGVGDSVNIGLSVNVPRNAYIVGVSISVFGQERTIVGEYFGQTGFLNNYVFLIDLLKAIPNAYNNVNGHLLICVPHN